MVSAGDQARLWFADELGSVAALTFDTPFDVAPGEQGPIELLELADGVGDGEQPPGSRAPVEVLSARGPPDRLAAAWTGSRGRRPGRRRPAGRRACAPPGPVERPVRRVEAGGGGSGAGWRPPPRRRRRARPRRLRRSRRRRRGPGARESRRARQRRDEDSKYPGGPSDPSGGRYGRGGRSGGPARPGLSHRPGPFFTTVAFLGAGDRLRTRRPSRRGTVARRSCRGATRATPRRSRPRGLGRRQPERRCGAVLDSSRTLTPGPARRPRLRLFEIQGWHRRRGRPVGRRWRSRTVAPRDGRVGARAPSAVHAVASLTLAGLGGAVRLLTAAPAATSVGRHRHAGPIQPLGHRGRQRRCGLLADQRRAGVPERPMTLPHHTNIT